MSHYSNPYTIKLLFNNNLHSGMIVVFKVNNQRRYFMVALNILMILLGFINSLNKKPQNTEAAQGEIGEVVLSWEGAGGSC
jgi:hypothetical protein